VVIIGNMLVSGFFTGHLPPDSLAITCLLG
jgi:hypothetical protein